LWDVIGTAKGVTDADLGVARAGGGWEGLAVEGLAVKDQGSPEKER
jgi:hypothetical protein